MNSKPPKSIYFELDESLQALIPPSKARRRKKTNLSNLARSFIEARLEAGMTQKELAQDSGVSLKSLRKIEQGDLNVKLTTLLKLVQFLNYDLKILPDDQNGDERR
jgi:DNA-binding XRE family transcriptional regulator